MNTLDAVEDTLHSTSTALTTFKTKEVIVKLHDIEIPVTPVAISKQKHSIITLPNLTIQHKLKQDKVYLL